MTNGKNIATISIDEMIEILDLAGMLYLGDTKEANYKIVERAFKERDFKEEYRTLEGKIIEKSIENYAKLEDTHGREIKFNRYDISTRGAKTSEVTWIPIRNLFTIAAYFNNKGYDIG